MAELGERMGISPTSVSSLERNEASGTAKMETIRRALQAMGMEPVVIAVDSSKAVRAEEAALRISRRVARTMSLEGQTISDEAVQELYDRVLRRELAKF